jgi:hypothetical protein
MEKGFIIYDGKSMIDYHSNIIAVMTTRSGNRKTGDVFQVWILNRDMNPVEAANAGIDSAICGNCPHRHYLDGACYVNIGQAPASVWKAYQRGNYSSDMERARILANGATIRIGAYGDPAAVPIEIWDDLLIFSHVLGYTHQWRTKPEMKEYCQASVDSFSDYQEAKANGWYCFRVGLEHEVLQGSECLSDKLGLSCKECRRCNGQKMDVHIRVHGARKNRFQAAIV